MHPIEDKMRPTHLKQEKSEQDIQLVHMTKVDLDPVSEFP